MKIIGDRIEGSPEELRKFFKDHPDFINIPLKRRWIVWPALLFLITGSIIILLKYGSLCLGESIETILIILEISFACWLICSTYVRFKSKTITITLAVICLVIISICFKFDSPKQIVRSISASIQNYLLNNK